MVKPPFDSLLSLISTLLGKFLKYTLFKRFIDIILSIFALIVFMPFMVIIALGIKVYSPGPILYRAKRLGLNGKMFTMFKFRTMHHINKISSASLITAKNDLRVFDFGIWLRRSKIDEFPQFINILRGEMSIVGPRPEDPQIVDKYYSSDYFETFHVLPGLTSPGSIYYYTQGEQMLSETDPENDYVDNLLPIKIAFDIIYVREISLVYDLKLVLRTFWTILFMAAGKYNFPDPPEIQKARNLVLQFKNSCDDYKGSRTDLMDRGISKNKQRTANL